MSGDARVHLDLRHGTAVATLDHPPVNTWVPDMLDELEAVISEIDAKPEIRSLILTGAGTSYFCAGADLRQFRHGSPDLALAAAERFHAAFDRLAGFRGVTIAALNGLALGGGLECALACDLRIAEEHVRLGLPEARVGLLPGGGGTQRLPRLIGEPRAKRMILLGEELDAVTAERFGLVDEVVPSGAALTTALGWAARARNSSPEAAATCKRLMRAERGDGFKEEQQAFANLFGTADQQEGVSAFLEKRQPVWGRST